MKKFLSMLLALAMVLTMAAFPAFAEGELTKATLTYHSDVGTHFMNDAHNFEKAYDGSTSTGWVSDQYGNGKQRDVTIDVVFELETAGMLDTLSIRWGGDNWGLQAVNKYNVCVSSDNETYTQILSYDALYDLAKATHTSSYGGTIEVTNASAQYRKINITETGLNAKNVKYIKLEIRNAQSRPGIFEIEAYTKDTAALVPATYTVKYQYADGTEALSPKTVEGNFVGDTVTETAAAITGYNPDEASKQLTLVDGTNEIVFTYTAREVATYTVYYQDTEGADIADATVVTEGCYEGDSVTVTPVTVPGYKPTETSKTVTLEAGENEITFEYEAKANVDYTIKYVDENGKEIAEAKTGSAYDEETIIAKAPAIAGYILNDFTVDGSDVYFNTNKVHVLDVDADNVITFTYKTRIVLPNPTLKHASGVGGAGAGNVKRFVDGELLTAFTYGNNNTTTDPSMTLTFTLPSLTQVEGITYLRTKDNMSESIRISTSIDGQVWTEVLNTTSASDYQTVVKMMKDDGTYTTAKLVQLDVTDTVAQYVKFEAMTSTGGWGGLYEFLVDGYATTLPNEIELTGENVISMGSLGGVVESEGKLGSADSLFDGEDATTANSFWGTTYYNGDKVVDTVNGINEKDGKKWPTPRFEVDLGGVYDLTYIVLQGGTSAWGGVLPAGYDVYVAGVDGEYELAFSYTSHELGATYASGAKRNIHEVDLEAVRYVKVVVTRASVRLCIGELDIHGTKVDLTTAPEKAGASLGGQIRLPDASLTAGLRFGATIMKGVVGADGIDYDFDTLAAAGAEIGMFMLPADMLGGQTLTQYLAGGVQNALKVPAKRILSEDDASVTFTAVLVDIPESAYNRDIVAVPYLKVGENYVYYAEMTKNYKGVATAVAESYKAGEIELTDAQIELLEKITGETLVVPAE